MATENTLKIEDFLKFTGIEVNEEMTQDDFHNAFREKYILKENAHEDETIRKTAAGRRLGSLETEFKKLAREFGIDFSSEDLSSAPMEDLFKHTFKTIKDSHEGKIKELKTSYDPTKKDEAVKEWEKKYKSLEKNYNETKGLLDTRVQEFEQFKDKTTKETKRFKLETIYSNKLNGAKFKQGITELEKKGFDATLKEKYKFDLDENDNFTLLNAKTGEKIPHPERMSDFMGLEDAIEKELKEAGLAPINDKAGTRLGASVVTPTPKTEEGTKTARRVHPSALR